MRSPLSSVAATLIIGIGLAAPAWAQQFIFTTGSPDGHFAALTQPASAGKIETETADDFVLTDTTVISRATIIGLLVPTGTPLASIGNVEVELYHIFPLDSDTTRTIDVPTRTNSPADVEIASATRDGSSGTLNFGTSLVMPTFTAATSVVNGIFKKPNQTTHGEGPMTGQEIEITIDFTTPIILPAGHYFFRPEVQVNGTGVFLYLSAPKPTATDLQAWIRNSSIKPDWLRIATDIIDATTPPGNMAFSLTGDTIAEAGTPGQANCHGKTVSALARQFGGTPQASLALGASSVDTLQNAITLFCGQ
jgi:hypothetical protein